MEAIGIDPIYSFRFSRAALHRIQDLMKRPIKGRRDPSRLNKFAADRQEQTIKVEVISMDEVPTAVVSRAAKGFRRRSPKAAKAKEKKEE